MVGGMIREEQPPMWKPEHRRAARRVGQRYDSDLTDAEWGMVGSLIPPPKRGGGKRTVDIREVLNGIYHVLYVAVREQEGREASPTAAIIDSQSAKAAQKGGPRLTRKVTMRARRSRGASGTSSLIRSACC